MGFEAWAPALIALLAWAAAVFGPVLLIRLAADYLADRRRAPGPPEGGGKLAVLDDDGRLSPTVIPPSVPKPPKPISSKVYLAMIFGFVVLALSGILAAGVARGSTLARYGPAVGFLGVLFVMGFADRYDTRSRGP